MAQGAEDLQTYQDEDQIPFSITNEAPNKNNAVYVDMVRRRGGSGIGSRSSGSGGSNNRRYSSSEKKEILARKVFKFQDRSPNDVKNTKKIFGKEVGILRLAQHHHVVKFIDAYSLESGNEPHMALIMERAENFERYLRNEDHSSLLQQWFGCLASAMTYIHSIGVRHRDIKPENILVRGASNTSRQRKPTKTVILADFGLSKMGIGKTLSTTMPEYARGRTPAYCAPEVDHGSTRGRSADIFPLGAIFLEMLVTCKAPERRTDLYKVLSPKTKNGPSYAENLDEVHEFMRSLEEKLPDDLSKRVLSLCIKMMDHEFYNRHHASEVQSQLAKDGIKCSCAAAIADPKVQLLQDCGQNKIEEVKARINEHKNLASTIGAIHIASAKGYKELVQTLHKGGAGVKLRDGGGQTALHCAAGYGHQDIVSLLLGWGADASLDDENGRKALHCAAGNGNKEIVEMLLKRDKSSATATDNGGQTPIHCAARRGCTEAVKILREQPGVNLNAADKTGRTAQHSACVYGSYSTVALLLSEEACKKKDKRNWTALHFLARGRSSTENLDDRREILKLLLKHGADVLAQDERNHYASAPTNGDPIREEIECRWAQAKYKANSPTNVSESLEALLQPPRNYSESEIKSIRALVVDQNPKRANVSCIYAIMHNMKMPNDSLELSIKEFVNRNVNDGMLPLDTFELDILSPGDKARFEKEQHNFLDQSFQPKKHCHIEEDTWKKDLNDQGTLGKGGFSEVLKVEHVGTRRQYALKLIKKKTQATWMSARNELEILQRIDHNNIVKFVGSFISQKHIGILTEPVARHNLTEYLSSNSEEEEKLALLTGYFGCLANALHYLHYEAYITHNDIKPENILVHHGRVLLTDFGTSVDWAEQLRTTQEGSTAKTLLYCAPEVAHSNRPRRSSADIWSLGCVFLELMTVIKKRTVPQLRDYFQRNQFQSLRYYDNHRAAVDWVDELWNDTSCRENTPLIWINDMLKQHPQSRPSAGTLLKKIILKAESSSSTVFFGDCCNKEKLTKMTVVRKPSHEESSIAPDFTILEMTSISCASWSSHEQRIFFQDNDNQIRQSTWRDYDETWLGRYDVNEIVGQAKPCSPITSVAWERKTGLRQPEVRVYFLNEQNCIRERIWNPLQEWRDGPLCEQRIQAASFSQLSATSWGDGKVLLCYQKESCVIGTLHGWAEEDSWQPGTDIQEAFQGSSLAAINFRMGANRGIRVYFQDQNDVVREACWDNLDDEKRTDSSHYLGGYAIPATPGGAIAAVAWGESWADTELQMRIYSAKPEGFYETPYGGIWNQTWRTVGMEANGRRIAVSERASKIQVFYVKDGKLLFFYC